MHLERQSMVGVPQTEGISCWNHWIWVLRGPLFQILSPMPSDWEKPESMVVAPMMAMHVRALLEVGAALLRRLQQRLSPSFSATRASETRVRGGALLFWRETVHFRNETSELHVPWKNVSP
jgi:hypothetical protein